MCVCACVDICHCATGNTKKQPLCKHNKTHLKKNKTLYRVFSCNKISAYLHKTLRCDCHDNTPQQNLRRWRFSNRFTTTVPNMVLYSPVYYLSTLTRAPLFRLNQQFWSWTPSLNMPIRLFVLFRRSTLFLGRETVYYVLRDLKKRPQAMNPSHIKLT